MKAPLITVAKMCQKGTIASLMLIQLRLISIMSMEVVKSTGLFQALMKLQCPV